MTKQVYKINATAYCYENKEELRKQNPYWIQSEITQHIKRLDNWKQRIIDDVQDGVVIKFEITVIR